MAAATQLGRLGFVGAGKICSAMVQGIISRCPAAAAVAPIVLSPRGRALALQKRYPEHVSVAADNQAVVSEADTVFLALRPGDAIAALEQLQFGPDVLVVSLMHGVAPAAIAAAAKGVDAGAVVRANPLPGCANGNGITALCPPHDAVCALFGQLGSVHAVRTLDELHVLHAASCLMGPIFELMHTGAVWTSTAQGAGNIADEAAEQYMKDLLSSVAAEACLEDKHGGFRSLVEQQTRGGLNENNIRRLTEAGAFDAASNALSTTLQHLHEANRWPRAEGNEEKEGEGYKEKEKEK